MEKQLKGKLALITGSSRGVGQQIAVGLAQRGADIILHGRLLENTSNTKQLLKDYDVNVYSVFGDLGTEAGINNIVSGVNAVNNGIDILYNNAAIMSDSISILERPIDSWHQLLNVNLFSIIKLCNAFIPNMIKNNYGRVVNMTSGIKDQPDLAAYGLSKAGVDKYSQDLAYALKGKNVLVNYLDPGWLKTDMGGESAWFEPETVLPGALVPALLEDNGPTGKFFMAQDYKYLK